MPCVLYKAVGSECLSPKDCTAAVAVLPLSLEAMCPVKSSGKRIPFRQQLAFSRLQQDDCLHIVMEYASEGDLAELIAKRAEEKKGFSEDEIMFWCVLCVFHACFSAQLTFFHPAGY